jgi:LEA14-like dessication related protein
MKKAILVLLTFLTAFILGSCAGIKVQPPYVTIAGIQILEAGLFEQRFTCKLRIQNPNDFEIHVTGVSFEVEINGQPFAKGVSNKSVTVPRLSEELAEVTAVSTLSSILRQIRELGKGEGKALSYRLKGQLATDSLGWLNFDESGTLEAPDLSQ